MENCDSEVPQFRLADLQLAAELGKSLLKRNKELDTQMNAYKSKAEEQEREIMHLRKLINVMGEENDSRLNVYEKLDTMLQDLERANERLSAEKIKDKMQIKMLIDNAEGLEARCEELTEQLNLTRQSLNKIDRYKQERNTNSPTPQEQEIIFPEIQSIVLARHENVVLCHDNQALSLAEESCLKTDDEDLIKLLGEMETIMRDYLTEQRRCVDLEEQLEAIIKENKCLQERLALASPRQNMMSVQEEFCLLDEVREGQMCSRCLANINESQQHLDDKSFQTSREEQDLRSKVNHTAIEDRLQDLKLNALEHTNPYQDVVEKYEALLEVKRPSSSARLLVDAKKTSAWNIPLAVQQQQQKEMDTKGSVVMLNMAPIQFWEAETTFSGKDNCSKIDISYFSSTAAKPLIPPPKEESSEEVSAISQNLAIGDHVSNVGCSYFSTTSNEVKEKVLVLRPLKRQLPESVPVATGMRKKNRRKHHDNGGNGNGALNQPQLLMGQCSVSDLGRGISWRVTAPSPSSPVLSTHLKGSAMMIDNQTPIGPKNSGITYAKVLRGANTSPCHSATKYHSYNAQRSQQANVQKRY